MSDSSLPVPEASPHHTNPCGGCGAHLEFAPGTDRMRCPYCGHEQRLAAPTRQVREHDIDVLLTKARTPASELASHRFACQGCGAHVQGDHISRSCQFCAAPLVADTSDDHQIEPEAVLPFALDRNGSREALRAWIKSRWFAPNRLKRVSEAESMKSTYLPHWTFDAQTVSAYTGQRGEYYYVTETYTVQENGESVQKTRQVRKTRWYPASGRVSRHFDDVLVTGTRQLAPERIERLEPWPLKQAVPYTQQYLSGHETLRYDVEPGDGLTTAKAKMAPVIRQDCRRDIGGDEQRVTSVDTAYSEVTGKLMLLPVWVGCYLYHGKSWQIVVNGCTGDVQGERPYSAAKITVAVIAALLLLTVLVLLFVNS